MKIAVATMERVDRLPMPHRPWPLVQPEAPLHRVRNDTGKRRADRRSLISQAGQVHRRRFRVTRLTRPIDGVNRGIWAGLRLAEPALLDHVKQRADHQRTHRP